MHAQVQNVIQRLLDLHDSPLAEDLGNREFSLTFGAVSFLRDNMKDFQVVAHAGIDALMRLDWP